MDTTTRTETDVVLAFLGHLEELDLDAAASLLADDAVYQNVPLPADRGKRAVERTLRRMLSVGSGFRVVNHNVAAEGPVVLTERTDVLSIGKGRFRVDAAFWCAAPSRSTTVASPCGGTGSTGSTSSSPGRAASARRSSVGAADLPVGSRP